jgi:hypothetical protein
MSKLNFDQMGKTVEGLLKALTFASKIGILAGGICVLGYSLRIGHFPQGLTIGDGLLFMLAAVCFGIIYTLFVASLVSLGVVMSPAIKLLTKLYVWSYKFRKARPPSQVYDFAKFSLPYLIFAIFAVLFILGLGSHDSNAYWNLPLLAIAMYFFYSGFLSAGEKIRNLEISQNSLVKIDKQGDLPLTKIQQLRKAQMLSLALILIMPMLLGGVTGQLLDGAMRQAHIRIESATIFVKEPYASLIPAVKKSKTQPLAMQYVKFDEILILSKGIGNMTVLYLPDGESEKRLGVPNDQLIVD